MKEKKIKFYLFPAKRYLGKVEHTKTLYKVTIASDLLQDEELFITVLIHELIHVDYDNLLLHRVITERECNFVDLIHDTYWVGDYCVLAVDQLHWNDKRKKRKMIL